MKQRTLKLTPEELIRAIQGKPAKLNLPEDLELIDIKYDAFSKQVTAVVRSDTFEDVAEGQPTPELSTQTPTPPQPSVTAATPVSVPTATPKTPPPTHPTPPIASPQRSLIQTLTASSQPSSSASIGTGVKTLGPKPEANLDTGGFEDEFTKEQRKVLRFAVDGDYVIVKPTQFLKTEWEDINDTVKSIGGKWVKGSIIDYWVIPRNQKKETSE
ncbi:MAG: hypothetical protein ACFCUE_14935 [Candidatus Bathyarchaeia archaeon]|jgi:hypothetical protein